MADPKRKPEPEPFDWRNPDYELIIRERAERLVYLREQVDSRLHLFLCRVFRGLRHDLQVVFQSPPRQAQDVQLRVALPIRRQKLRRRPVER